MGVYLVPELIKMGYSVDVYSLEEVKSENDKLKYFVGNAVDMTVLKEILKTKYTAIVDFMIYTEAQFKERYELFLSATKQYVYLSSYRVYANEELPIKETSPRLFDVMEERDKDFFATPDYSLLKAKGEELLKNSGSKNWTIIRPAVTYSKRRLQLMTLEGVQFIPRTLKGKKVIVPKEALSVQGTMSWAGDVAKMIALLIENEKALGESFTVSTSEHHSWGEIADYYKELIGLEIVPVDTEIFLQVISAEQWRNACRYQLIYDRLFDRVIDNRKILEVTGLKQEDLMPLYEGLKLELSDINTNTNWINGSTATDERMDNYLNNL